MTKRNENSKTIFHGFKHRKPVYCRRKAHRDFLIYLERDDSVKSYFQPGMRIVLHHGKNKNKSVLIDFQVERFGNRTELVHFYFSEKMHADLLETGNEHARRLKIKFTPLQAESILKMLFAENLQK